MQFESQNNLNESKFNNALNQKNSFKFAFFNKFRRFFPLHFFPVKKTKSTKFGKVIFLEFLGYTVMHEIIENSIFESEEKLYKRAIKIIEKLHLKILKEFKDNEKASIEECKEALRRSEANKIISSKIEEITVGLISGNDVKESRNELKKIISEKNNKKNFVENSKDCLLKMENTVGKDFNLESKNFNLEKNNFNLEKNNFNLEKKDCNLENNEEFIESASDFQKIDDFNDSGFHTPTYFTDTNEFVCQEEAEKKCFLLHEKQIIESGLDWLEGERIDYEKYKRGKLNSKNYFIEKKDFSKSIESDIYHNNDSTKILDPRIFKDSSVDLNYKPNFFLKTPSRGFFDKIMENRLNIFGSRKAAPSYVVNTICIHYRLIFPEYEISKLNDVFKCESDFYSIKFSSGYEFTKEAAKDGAAILILEYIDNNWKDLFVKDKCVRAERVE